MGRKPGKGAMLELTFSNAEQFQLLSKVLKYEAATRYITVGQAFTELVMDGIDERDYPDAILNCLDEIREDVESHAINEAISAANLAMSA